MFNNEEKLLEIRLNVLNKFVDHFVIIESEETHSGNKKKITFEIDKYPKFKEKIIYKKINSFPIGLSSWQKENYQRNYIVNCLNQANGDDIVMISDLDEIPNLENVNLNNYNEKIIVFNQRLFFYKMNFGANAANWQEQGYGFQQKGSYHYPKVKVGFSKFYCQVNAPCASDHALVAQIGQSCLQYSPQPRAPYASRGHLTLQLRPNCPACPQGRS